jgi:hypothetical protein
MAAKKRHRFKHTTTLAERLEREAERLREQAHMLPFGPKRIQLRHKLRRAETALRIDQWLSSPSSLKRTVKSPANFTRDQDADKPD